MEVYYENERSDRRPAHVSGAQVQRVPDEEGRNRDGPTAVGSIEQPEEAPWS